ncbi:ATP-grasp domain-containing protein [Brevundimonas aurantiaca]|jgi:glutathione synthase/RimK-type ligase-like ATP-grasp enzyme|uniref:ATP-grasp domain-containing protein n=1 Tax=Brevundimonas aurantiaca TaxID=74316 RepID=UPI00174CABC2|nr:hypothetical protein [Brevundimonas aurantiaca]
MTAIALVTADACVEDDLDMPPLLEACRIQSIDVEVCAWDDPRVDWSQYGAVVLRSPWDYVDRIAQFLAWCDHVSAVSELFNPLAAVRWSLDKHYLLDLADRGIPVVPTRFIEPAHAPAAAVIDFLADFPQAADFVIKPAIGCYSRGIQRFARHQTDAAIDHIAHLASNNASVVLQPYLPAIDKTGETNLVFFDGVYSHAICKSALLGQDGAVNVPTYDYRSPREADAAERTVATAALEAARSHLGLRRPLLYARVDLIRGHDNTPRLLELEIAEPSLSLPLTDKGATRFAQSLDRLVMVNQGA